MAGFPHGTRCVPLTPDLGGGGCSAVHARPTSGPLMESVASEVKRPNSHAGSWRQRLPCTVSWQGLFGYGTWWSSVME